MIIGNYLSLIILIILHIKNGTRKYTNFMFESLKVTLAKRINVIYK